MNDAMKIKKQAAELKDVQSHIIHYGDMVKMAVQALQYIATGGKNMQPEESKIVLLNQVGIPGPTSSVTPPKVVAMECLELLQAMTQKHSDELKPGSAVQDAAPKTEIDHVRLIDGEEIIFSTAFDAMFHKCCDCGLLHEVHLDWIDLMPKTPGSGATPILRTKWFRRDSDPTIEELESKGEVVSLKEVKQ